MFRRRSPDERSSTTGIAVLEDQPRDPQAPKGRPTPKRSEAQGQRRKAMVVPTDRKAAARQARDSRRTDMAKQRAALAGGGDERYLPARDRGPLRKFARDYVDSRARVAEFFLPMAVLILVLSIVQAGSLQTLVLLLWLVVIVGIVADSFVTALRLRAELRTRYPDENARGVIPYALMRTLQMRRLRLPKPQVRRGTKL